MPLGHISNTRFRLDCLNCYVRGSTTTCAATYSATVHCCRATSRPVCTYTFATRQTTLRMLRPGGSQLSGRIRRHFLACEDVAGGSQQSGGKHFFHEIRWPVWWVPAIRWRNNYFARNKEALPCCGRGPSCQPLHVQYSFDEIHSLTTLTTPRREHQGGGPR